MKEPKHSGFSPEVEALVAQERALPAQPEDLRARLLSRAHTATLAAPPTTRPVPMPRGASSSLVASTAAVTVAAGIAAAVYLSRDPAPGVPPAKAPPSATSRATAPSALPSPTTAPDPAPPAPSTRVEPSEPSAPIARSTATNQPSRGPEETRGPEEIELLSRARRADARGDYGAVLSVLSEHERNFPAGRLSEEREVLRVKALVGLGRTDQARRAGARFRRQFPRSVLLPKIDEMLASVP